MCYCTGSQPFARPSGATVSAFNLEILLIISLTSALSEATLLAKSSNAMLSTVMVPVALAFMYPIIRMVAALALLKAAAAVQAYCVSRRERMRTNRILISAYLRDQRAPGSKMVQVLARPPCITSIQPPPVLAAGPQLTDAGQ